jgi:hypothetical protein
LGSGWYDENIPSRSRLIAEATSRASRWIERFAEALLAFDLTPISDSFQLGLLTKLLVLQSYFFVWLLS